MKIIKYFDKNPHILVLSIFCLTSIIGCIIFGPKAFFGELNNPKKQQKEENVDKSSFDLSPAENILRDMQQHQITF